MKKNNKILLIDGSFYLYKCYYGIPKLKNSLGQIVNVIYGMLNVIKFLFTKYRPQKAAIIFDYKGKTFRNKIFSQYKSQRKSMPLDLLKQIKPLIKIIKFLGITSLSIKNFESDDVIGTLCSILSNNIKNFIVIATGDKDMLQLLNTNIQIHDKKNNIIIEKNFLEKYGFLPNLMVDFLALMGDSSDNIPGVPGIGVKTAQNLVSKVGNLQYIYQNLNNLHNMKIKISNKLINILEENKKLAFMSYRLAKIKIDINLNLKKKCLLIKKVNQVKILNILKKYEIKSWFQYFKKNKTIF